MSKEGRPPLGAQKRTVQFSGYLTKEEAEQLDRARGQQSRSDFVRAALHAALAQREGAQQS